MHQATHYTYRDKSKAKNEDREIAVFETKQERGNTNS